jgi:hypothetical protein
MYTGPNFEIDKDVAAQQDAAYQQMQQEEVARQAQEKEAKAAEQKQQAELAANTDPKTGRPKSSQLTANPKEFGLGENLQELGNALGGGLVDTVNDVTSLPKFLDPKFYQKGDDYKPPIAQIEAPVTRTVWGNVIRTGVNFLSMGFGTGALAVKGAGLAAKLGKGGQLAAKGLQWYGASKTSVGGRLIQGAAQGAVTDVISNQSQKSNLTAELIKLKPEWEDALGNFATNENMSPAQRSLYNVVEGMGIGLIADAALEGVGAGLRGVREASSKAAAQVQDPELSKLFKDRQGEALKNAEELAYQRRGLEVEGLASKTVMRKEFNALKKNGEIHPEMTFNDYLGTNPKSAWNGMTPEDKLMVMEEMADKHGINWGPTKAQSARQTYQENVTGTRAVDELNRNPENYMEQMELDVGDVSAKQDVDPATGAPAPQVNPNPPPRRSFDVIEGDVTQGVNSSVTDNVFHGVRDQHRIRTEWAQSDGAPRGGLTDANIGRIANGAPGQSLEEIKSMTQRLVDDPSYQAHIEWLKGNKKAPEDVKAIAQEIVDDFYGSRGINDIADLTVDDIAFDSPLFGKNRDRLFGQDVLDPSGVYAVDLLIGQGVKKVRDIARLAGSVGDQVDILEQDGIGRTLYENMLTLLKYRKESSTLHSYGLSAFSSPKMPDEVLNAVADASDSAKSLLDDIFNTISKDTDDNLLRLYTDSLSKSENFTNLKDLHAFMAKKLHGYTDGDSVQRNAILREMNGVMINSFLSGPRTVSKATFSTGFNSFLRPVATIVGSTGSYIQGNDRTLRSAMYELGGMLDGVGEAWQLVKKSWNAQIGAELPDSHLAASAVGREVSNIKDIEWQQQGAFFMAHGSDGDKAAWLMADKIRTLNNNPFFSWAAKAMEAGDTGWRHLIARGRLKAMAFNEAYDTLTDAGRTASDTDIQKILPQISEAFHSKVWSEDGIITDQIAKMAADEVTMTRELQGFGKKLDEAFSSNAFMRPFLLFARTSWNSLELTGKHMPVVNQFIKEVHDIKHLDINAPDDAAVLKNLYGISTPEELASAQALIRGREAIGMSAVTVAATAFMSGTITGNGPPDRQLRDAWIQAGWRPRSIKIGDKYISYDAVEPLNSILSTVADIGDASLEMGENWAEQQFGRLGYILAQNVTNKSFMTGLTQLVDVLQMKGGRPAMVAGSLVNGLVPLAGARNEMGRLLAPGMRELDASIADSIRNRNLWTDVITPDGQQLPYRYDILNGTKLNDYDFMTRAFNAVSPFQVNIGTTPTRELLFRSLFDVKTTVNSGPNGEALTPQMKSRYQFLIGKQNLEAQLTELFKNPDVVKSIIDMEADRAAGRRYDASTTLHNDQIRKMFDQAKRQAWIQMKNEDSAVAQEVRKQALTRLAGERRKGGSTEDANAILNMRNK